MKINRNNYEAYLLDMVEGRLTDEEQQMVRDFLLLNPDCMMPVGDLELTVLEGNDIFYPDREKLKKTFPDAGSELKEDNFDLFSIARLENDLTPLQEKAHQAMVTRDEIKMREWESWKHTKLIPTVVSLPEKERLKKKAKVSPRMVWISVISAAAVITLLVTIWRVDPGILESRDRKPVSESAFVEERPGEGLIEQDQTPENVSVLEEPPAAIRMSDQRTAEAVALSGEEDPVALAGEEEMVASSGKKVAVAFSGEENMGLFTESSIDKDNRTATTTEEMILRQGSSNSVSGRIRIAGLKETPRDLIHPGTYDRITPIEVRPSSIHLTSLSMAQLSDIDLQQLFNEFTEENEISIWSIASSGIKGFNRLTGSDISLLAQKDDEGALSAISFRSRLLTFSTSLDREE
ncbi:MAG: hypothetical protein R6U78_12350 [Bacteroidales bacterium]